MDAVLGLSMTPTTVGLVLVEGQEAEDGATMDKDEFAVTTAAWSAQSTPPKRRPLPCCAPRRSPRPAGHRLHSIGVTWSEDANAEASLLLESLSESGFDNVIAVRFPEATEALAQGDRQRHRRRHHRRLRH